MVLSLVKLGCVTMGLKSRKTETAAATPEAATPALDIGALIAAEVAKALAGLNLPAAGAAAPAAPKAAPAAPPVKVLPPAPAKVAPLIVADGYWSDNVWTPYSSPKGKESPFKIQGLKGAFQGVPLTLLAELFERIDDVAAAVAAWAPKNPTQEALKGRLVKAMGI